MIKEIVKDSELLKKKCDKATMNDLHIVKDLIDTANQYKENCCGLAANQIGYDKRIAIIVNGEQWLPMINPVIVDKSTEKHESEEGCMSLEGTRTVERYNKVTVMFQDLKGKFIKVKASGFIATVMQHEIDHLNGVLI